MTMTPTLLLCVLVIYLFGGYVESPKNEGLDRRSNEIL